MSFVKDFEIVEFNEKLNKDIVIINKINSNISNYRKNNDNEIMNQENKMIDNTNINIKKLDID